MSDLSTLAPLVKEHFGLTGIFKSLPGDEDLNSLLISTAGDRYTVKMMRADCPEDLIKLQCDVLDFLQTRELSFQIPRVMLSRQGRTYEIVVVSGQKRILWILSWCPGTLLAQFKPATPSLFDHFGEKLGELDAALKKFSHPAQDRTHRWALSEALTVKDYVSYTPDGIRPVIQHIFHRFSEHTAPLLSKLPKQIIHNDANDYNVLVQIKKDGTAYISGLFDFGDLAYQPPICELAIAIAYAIFEKEFPLRIAARMVKAYHQQFPLSVTELEILFDLIKTRLAVSVAISSQRQRSENDPYLTISQAPAIAALHTLHGIPDSLALATFRQACGYPATKHHRQVLEFIKQERPNFHPPVLVDSWEGILDLSVASRMLGADPQGHLLPALQEKIKSFSDKVSLRFTIGRYLESRRLYAAPGFHTGAYETQEKRTQHLGIDIFGPAGTPVYAPLDGTIYTNTIIDLPLDYGGLIVLRHETTNGTAFFTLYGHLEHKSLDLAVGTKVEKGQQIARFGAPAENGGWPPHLHWQLIMDDLGLGEQFPGVAYAEELPLYESLCPNPMLLVKDVNPQNYNARVDTELLLHRRQKNIGYNLSLSYNQPLHIVAGFRQFLYDSSARTYLDFYNNVPHVGHQHPMVVKAIQEQAALLNTNTRYLHENMLEYADKLKSRLPAHLEICYFVNSASEANELALRMARAHTNRQDIMVAESAYHGHTSTLIDISPYKHDGPGGHGAPTWVHQVPIADDYRGKYKRAAADAGFQYAKEVKQKLNQLEKEGRWIAAFIAETYPSVGGQIIPPADYLQAVYAHVRAHGGLCIADEVQTGFGRLGASFWAFESQEVLPDMVVLGKPIGNGFPLAALITTKAIAQSFDNGMEYFSTYGGNPVACAAGLAVLEVIEQEGLQQNASLRGQEIMQHFQRWHQDYQLIGDVRGKGLFLGMELVKDRQTLEPAQEAARYIVNRLKEKRILAGVDGPLHNVLKFRPSMVITPADVAYFAETMEAILQEDFLSKAGS